MKIKILLNVGRALLNDNGEPFPEYREGETYEVSTKDGSYLCTLGVAELVEELPLLAAIPKEPMKAVPPKRKAAISDE